MGVWHMVPRFVKGFQSCDVAHAVTLARLVMAMAPGDKPDIAAVAGHPDIPLKGECPECPASRTCGKTEMSGMSGKTDNMFSHNVRLLGLCCHFPRNPFSRTFGF
jgi:hypothetical protein